ncbi:MAG: thiamine phosphate synthase [Candidatus Omnitrophica bacterium]|nr:thiamine phosphate synthase [Candidatus Omnitrophota bacterium]
MQPKKELLKKSRLYVIIDKRVLKQKDISSVAVKTRDSGADIIQLRDKGPKKDSIVKNAFLLHKLLSKNKAIYIVNDYLDIAKIFDADGIHLGQSDTSIGIARRVLGNDKIIGISCHNLKEAIDAQKKGADYIGIGPLFTTLTKPTNRKTISPGLIKKLQEKIKIPFFAIGGINKNNINRLTSLGLNRAAISSAILTSKDITKATRYFSRALN